MNERRLRRPLFSYHRACENAFLGWPRASKTPEERKLQGGLHARDHGRVQALYRKYLCRFSGRWIAAVTASNRWSH